MLWIFSSKNSGYSTRVYHWKIRVVFAILIETSDEKKLEHDLNYANKKYFHPRFSSIIFVIIHINISNAWSSFSILKFWRKKEHSLGTIIIIIEIWKNVRPIIVN